MSQPTIPKPPPCSVRSENIPEEMKARNQWVCWKWVWKTGNTTGKWDKPPYDPKNGRHAKSNDARTWAGFDVALAAYQNTKNGYSGIGYMFSGDRDDFTGIDLDDCRDVDTGGIHPWTTEQRACEHWTGTAPEPTAIIEAIGTYTEVSPSGTGVKLILRGELNGGMKHGDIEMYRSGRYFTVTGHRLPGCPSAIATYDGLPYLRQLFSAKNTKSKLPREQPRKTTPARASALTKLPTADQVLAACYNASNGARFRQLFDRGDTSEYADGTDGHSEADSALCCLIAFFACGDIGLIDKIFRQSKLMRAKWDEARGAQTYGQRTIDNALTVVTKFYEWSRLLGDATAKLIGSVRLVPKCVKRTSSKISVQVEVQKDGKALDLVKLTDSASNRKAALKSIVARAGDEADAVKIDEALGLLLVEAASSDKSTGGDGKTVYEILTEYVPSEVDLQYATEGGKAFSARLGKPISRTLFVERFTSNHVLKLASTGSDAPRNEDDEILRPALCSMVERELKLLWGELYRALKSVEEAELTDESPTAITFRQAIIALWTKPASMGIHKTTVQEGQSIQLATRNSLAMRVRRHEENDIALGRWHAVQEGFDAFMRIEHGQAAGERRIVLGMRYELAEQIGVKLPDATNQTALTRLGVKFGAVDQKPVVFNRRIPVRMTGGAYLTVLSESLTETILALPTEEQEPEENPPSETETASGSSPSEGVSDEMPSLEGICDGMT